MRTPERGQLEAYTIGCQKPPRGFSGQPRHTVTCPRLDLLYQTVQDCARGEQKKLLFVVAPPSRRLSGGRPRPPRRARDALRTAGKMPALRIPPDHCSVDPTPALSRNVTGPGRFQISHRRLRTDTHSRTRILDPGLRWYRAGRPALHNAECCSLRCTMLS
jgi:hypothetical protein